MGPTVVNPRLNRTVLSWLLAGLHAAGVMAAGNGPSQELAPVMVLGVTPIDGTGVPLSQFPANAQTLRAHDTREQGATNLADLLNNNLGPVSVSDSTGSPYQNDVNYRGFQASSLLGAPVGLSVWFDGVRMNEPFGSVVNWDLIPMNALASVNVLPGSNPMFGLNTLGGALVANTKDGRDHQGTSLTLLGGSFNRRAVQFETGGADEARGSDYFLAGNVDRQDGFREHSASDVKQLFGKLRWQANGGKTRFDLSGALAETRLHGTQSLPQDMMGNTAAAYTWPDTTDNRMVLFNLKASHWLNDSNQIAGNIHYRKSDARSANSNAQPDPGCDTQDCSGAAPSGTAINAVTDANALALGYRSWGSAINTSVVQSATRQETVGASLQWSSFDKLFGHGNAFTLGGLYDESRIGYQQDTHLARLIGYQTVITPNEAYGFTSDGLAPSGANPLSFTGSNVLKSVNLSSTTRDFSLYFTDTVELTDKLSATASGSFNVTTLGQAGVNSQYLNDDGGWNWTDAVSGITYYNAGYAGAYKYDNAGAGYASANAPSAGWVAGPESNSLNGSHRYQRFNPALGFNYNFDAANGVFGSYSESMRAPTAIELSCADPNSPCALPTGFNGDPDLKAVVAKTVEFGARGMLGDKVSWSAAVYDSRLKDDIQFIATSASFGYFSNVGDTERRGFEVGAQARLDRWHLAASLGYVDAFFRTPFTTAGGQNVTSGNRIPGIPAKSFKLRARYAANSDLTLGGNLILVGPQYTHGNESNSDPDGQVAGYGLVNLDLRYRVAKDLELTANVTNLFNKQYSTYGLSGVTSIYTLATQPFITPAPPRSVWLGLTYTFGGKAAKKDRD